MVVQLVEDGEWESPTWARSADDDKFIAVGWKVVTYEGEVLFKDKQEQPVRQWLKDEGWHVVGDGVHFQK